MLNIIACFSSNVVYFCPSGKYFFNADIDLHKFQMSCLVSLTFKEPPLLVYIPGCVTRENISSIVGSVRGLCDLFFVASTWYCLSKKFFKVLPCYSSSVVYCSKYIVCKNNLASGGLIAIMLQTASGDNVSTRISWAFQKQLKFEPYISIQTMARLM